MKKEIKGFVVGMLVMMLITGTVFATPVSKTIDVVFNKVNFTVNGQKIEATNILYEGTTYIPLRAAAEALGKEVGWDPSLNTASINDKKENVSIGDSNNVADQIKAKAAEEWPEDYQMQKYVIEQETKAYNTIKDLVNTPDYNAKILKKAIEEWPGDYQMQLYIYEQELKAYKELNQ